MAKKLYAGIVFMLLIGVAVADTSVDVSVTTDGDVNSTTNINTDGDVTSNNNFNNNGSVDVYFNGVNWKEIPTNVRVESNVEAAMGAFQEALKVMADYRSGRITEIEPAQYKMLMYFMSMTDDEISSWNDAVLEPQLKELRDWLNSNTQMINAHEKQIHDNSALLIQTRQEMLQGFTTLGYQVEAQDLALKRINKDVYCMTLIEVMKEHGILRVKCDINSRYCYNGNHFPWEGGRDYCLELDDQHNQPACYKAGTCGTIGAINVLASETGSGMLIMVDFTNPSNVDRAVTIHAEIATADGEIVSSCKQLAGYVRPGEDKGLSIICKNDLSPGTYTTTISVEAAGKEVIDKVSTVIQPKNTITRNSKVSSIQMTSQRPNLPTTVSYVVENLGDVPLEYEMTLLVTYNGDKMIEQKQTVILEPRSTKRMEDTFTLLGAGDYKVRASTEDSSSSMEFKIDSTVAIVGAFISYSPGQTTKSALYTLIFLTLITLYPVYYILEGRKKDGDKVAAKP